MVPARAHSSNALIRTSIQVAPDDIDGAVGSLAPELNSVDLAFAVAFLPTRVPYRDLGHKLQSSVSAPVFGCTTAGELTDDGFQQSSMVAVGFPSDSFAVHPFEIPNVQNPGEAIFRSIVTCAEDVRRRGVGAFAILLIDGMSLAEERIAAQCDLALGGIPLFGGSAGDDAKFESTWVLRNGEFATGGALLLLVETNRPFHVFQMQHLIPIGAELVITAACPEERVVLEMDGIPAVEAYAAALGRTVDALTPEVCERHPLAIRIGGVDYIRSIQKVHDDGSIRFYCAIEEGLVLSVTKPDDFVRRLRDGLESVTSEVEDPELILACECIQRRQVVESLGLVDDVASVLQSYPIVGFHTYGEQLRGLHLNQTLTGVVIGR
ncbi:MAG: FIST N-terminal domain-containing protein [Candidatus Eisenbacteria bacterium]